MSASLVGLVSFIVKPGVVIFGVADCSQKDSSSTPASKHKQLLAAGPLHHSQGTAHWCAEHPVSAGVAAHLTSGTAGDQQMHQSRQAPEVGLVTDAGGPD